jgi:hypothetical protein
MFSVPCVRTDERGYSWDIICLTVSFLWPFKSSDNVCFSVYGHSGYFLCLRFLHVVHVTQIFSRSLRFCYTCNSHVRHCRVYGSLWIPCPYLRPSSYFVFDKALELLGCFYLHLNECEKWRRNVREFLPQNLPKSYSNVLLLILYSTYILRGFKTSGNAFRLPHSIAFDCYIRQFWDLFHSWLHISHLSGFFWDGLVFSFHQVSSWS